MAHVLVIDDSPTCRQLLRLVLEDAGHRVSEAADGAAGLRLFRSDPPDVVFCDIFMPNKDGIETVRQLRREAPAARIVAVSGGLGGLGRLDLLPAAVKLGADLALHKPLMPAEVLGALECLRPAAG